MQIKIFDRTIWNIYLVVFTEFIYENKFYIQYNDNRNRQIHEIDRIK